MTETTPLATDAELLLRVYELRREPVMRESRTAINGQFWPRTFEDVAAVTKPDHPLNAAFRQTNSYWEMVFSIARHGIVHPEFWVENNGEGMFLFAKIAPHLTRYRAEISPVGFRNAEWAATETAEGRRFAGMFEARIQQVMAAR